jgi:hypothetical protein
MEKILHEILAQQSEAIKTEIIKEVKYRLLQKIEMGLHGRLFDIRKQLAATYKDAGEKELQQIIDSGEVATFINQAIAETITNQLQAASVAGLARYFNEVQS